MKYWNTRLKEMTEYIPGDQPADLDTFIKLNTNENPFPPSERVLAAIRDAANPMLRRYPDPMASGVRRGDEFLGMGAVPAVLAYEAGLERVRRVMRHSAGGAHCAGTRFA